MRNALTIDVEEYFHAHAYERVIGAAAWDRLPGRVVENTRRILALLARHRARATFFVLGWVADRHPELVLENCGSGAMRSDFAMLSRLQHAHKDLLLDPVIPFQAELRDWPLTPGSDPPAEPEGDAYGYASSCRNTGSGEYPGSSCRCRTS